MTIGPSEFFEAIKKGDRQAVEAMLAGDDTLIDAHDAGNLSAVLTALYYQEPEIADLLIDRGAVLDVFEASAAGRVIIVTEMLDGHPDLVTAWAPDGFQPLGLACFFGHTEMVDLLLRRAAPVNSPSRNPLNVQPINSAVAGRHLEITRMLLDHGADPNALQGEGFTPLHGAAQNGQIEMIELLLSRGADPTKKNAKGQTPREIALEAGHTQAAELL